MKTRFFLFISLLLLSGFSLKAQDSRLSYKLYRLAYDENKALEPVSVLIRGQVGAIREAVNKLGGHFKYSSGNIASVIIPAQALLPLSQNPAVQRMEEGAIQMTALNDQMLIKNRIDMVHNGIAPLPKGYDGANTIVGIIDTGMDFNHPDFKDSLGKSRILWIWDHNLAVSPRTPSLYGYGQEFSKADIDAGLAANTFDYSGHGTHVGGVATSNGRLHPEYTGVAPKAGIISVALNFNLDDNLWLSSVADAVDYIYSKADSAGVPCVINISAGTYFGSHDGRDLQAQLIDNLITEHPGRALSAACGNAGGLTIHLKHTITNDTMFTWFNNASGIYIECWADTANATSMFLTVGADAYTPVFEDRGQLNWNKMSQNLNVQVIDTLFSKSGNKLAKVTKFAQRIGGTYSMIYYIEPDSTNYFYRLESKGTGTFDLWSFDMINSGIPAPSAYPIITKYQLPDLNQSMCSSFQCSDKVITVGQYVNKNHYVDVNGNLQTFPTTEGDLAASSSWGPTRDGRIKPDITSTGEMTLSALRLTSVAFFLANQPYKLAPDSIHIRDGGTSTASPVVAGMGALFFQKNPTATWNDYKTRVMLCAASDAFTGSNLPDSHWGHGKLDGFAVMVGCNALGLADNEMHSNLELIPNPAGDFTNIQLPSDLKEKLSVGIYTMIGSEVYSYKNLMPNQNTLTIDLKQLPSGVYIIRLSDSKKLYTAKLIRN